MNQDLDRKNEELLTENNNNLVEQFDTLADEDNPKKKRKKRKWFKIKHLILFLIFAFLSFFTALNYLKKPSTKPNLTLIYEKNGHLNKKYPQEIILTFEIENENTKVNIIGTREEGTIMFKKRAYTPLLKEAKLFLNGGTIKNTDTLTLGKGKHTVTYKFDFNLKTCEGLFANCIDITNIKFVDLNANKVTSTKEMFLNCKKLRKIEGFTYLHTINVLDMSKMFAGCEALKSVETSSFITTKVTTLEKMFYDCKSLKYIDVSSFKTENAIKMNSMFHNCKSLTSVDMSRFSSKNCNNMADMFAGCHSITSLDFSTFKTSYTYCGGMFYDTPNLKEVKIPYNKDCLKIKNEVEVGLNRNTKIVYNYDYDYNLITLDDLLKGK